jgi:hypothetical protein
LKKGFSTDSLLSLNKLNFMKKLSYLFSIVAFVACSRNHLGAYFTHYDTHTLVAENNIIQPSSLPVIEPEMLSASIERKPLIKETVELPETGNQGRYKQKIDIKKIKKEVIKKSEKKSTSNAKIVNVSGGLDPDLKLASIFGVVGVVGLIIGHIFGVIGAISLIIGVVFFVKWLIRQ